MTETSAAMNYKLTIDSNLLHETTKIPSIDVLKRWKSEGKIELVEADAAKAKSEPAYGWPGSPPRPINTTRDPRGGNRGHVKKESAGKANFKALSSVLFPGKDSQRLNMGEINNVAHLVKHSISKNEFFVTHNLKDYITGGKREVLRGSFGIVTVTPDEAVDMLKKLEGWK